MGTTSVRLCTASCPLDAMSLEPWIPVRCDQIFSSMPSSSSISVAMPFCQFDCVTKPVFSKSKSDASEMHTVSCDVCWRLDGALFDASAAELAGSARPVGMMRAGIAQTRPSARLSWTEHSLLLNDGASNRADLPFKAPILRGERVEDDQHLGHWTPEKIGFWRPTEPRL